MSSVLARRSVAIVFGLVVVLHGSVALAMAAPPEALQVSGKRSLTAARLWTDRSGKRQELDVIVDGACDSRHGPFDGQPSEISVSLKRLDDDVPAAEVRYQLKNYQTQMLHFSANDMWAEQIGGKQAFFVPFGYCGNFDQDKVISLAMIYDGTATVRHIHAHCVEGSACTFPDRAAKKNARPGTDAELRGLPDAVKSVIRQRLKEDYAKDIDFDRSLFSSVGIGNRGLPPGTQAVQVRHVFRDGKTETLTNAFAFTCEGTPASYAAGSLFVEVQRQGTARTVAVGHKVKGKDKRVRFDPEEITYLQGKGPVTVVVPFASCDEDQAPTKSYLVLTGTKAYDRTVPGCATSKQMANALDGLPTIVQQWIRFSSVPCAPSAPIA